MAWGAIRRSQASLQTLAALTLVVGATLLPGDIRSAEGHAEDARPKCRGHIATIVGTPRDDEIVGTARADVIVGGAGMDNIYGGAGNDIICGGPGLTRIPQDDTAYQLLDGGLGNDVIVGGPHDDAINDQNGSDLILGRGGDDSLSANDRRTDADADVLRGGAGGDLLYGRWGADTLDGGEGDDHFEDVAGDNTLRGGSGNDRFESGPDNDTIIGGAGNDSSLYIAIHRGSLTALGHCNDITADLSTGVASGEGFGVDALRGIENLATSGGDDLLTGDHADNTFYVGGPCPGEDATLQRNSVAGGSGSDRIDFNSSTWDYSSDLYPVEVDLARGSAVQRNPYSSQDIGTMLSSIENVTGTPFPDVIYGDDGPNRLAGGWPQSIGEADAIYGRGGDDHLSGSDGRDTVYGDEGDDTLRGLKGNDRLDGGPGANLIRGGPGKDACQSPDRHDGALTCEE